MFQFDVLSTGLDLEFDADLIPTSAEPCNYETIYLTSHKSACRTAAFNNDGSFHPVQSLPSLKVNSIFLFLHQSVCEEVLI